MRKIRYGVIGTGMMGIEHLRNLAVLEGAEVRAIADPHPGSLTEAARFVDEGTARYDDFHTLLERDDIDAVVIATPNDTHVDVLEAVWKTEKHVLLEKPIATRIEDCYRVAKAAESHAGKVWVGMGYRYMPPVERLLQHVDGGTIGTLRMLALREHRQPFLPKIGDWNRFNRRTGGTLVEKCCHFFDLMRRITGSDAVRVSASAGQDCNHLDERYDGQTPDILDNAFVIVDFESGARALLDLCMFADTSRNQEEICATGELGKVECFVPESRVDVCVRATGKIDSEHIPVDESLREIGSHEGATFVEHRELCAAIREDRSPEVTARDGLEAALIGFAAQRSAREGRTVELQELRAQSVPLEEAQQ